MADTASSGSPALRNLTFAVVAAHVLFLAYAIYAILTAPAGDGTGMNLVGLVPLGFLFLVFAVPALSYARNGKPQVGIVLALLGLGATQWLWWGIMVREIFS